jgi:hypothetical protein
MVYYVKQCEAALILVQFCLHAQILFAWFYHFQHKFLTVKVFYKSPFFTAYSACELIHLFIFNFNSFKYIDTIHRIAMLNI